MATRCLKELGLLAVGISMLIGIIFGLLPANKAAKLDQLNVYDMNKQKRRSLHSYVFYYLLNRVSSIIYVSRYKHL